MRQRWNVLTALVAMATCGPVLAVETVATRSFVLRAGRVYPVAADQPWVIESGVIIVRDGRIVAVGHDLPLPPDLPVIDLPDATVMPGLVLAASSLAPPHSGDESIAAAYLAVDAYLPYGNYQAALAGGVTTVHLHPGEHRLVTGQGGVVKLGGPIDNRVLRFRADLTVNFRESAYRPPRDVTYQTPSSSDVAIPPAVRQRPDSRLGQFLALDEALALSEPVEFASFQLAALARAWQSGVPLRVQVQREADIEGALMWLKRRQRSAYLVGGAEADRAVDAIRRANVPLVFQMAPGIGGSVDDIGFDPDALDSDIRGIE